MRVVEGQGKGQGWKWREGERGVGRDGSGRGLQLVEAEGIIGPERSCRRREQIIFIAIRTRVSQVMAALVLKWPPPHPPTHSGPHSRWLLFLQPLQLLRLLLLLFLRSSSFLSLFCSFDHLRNELPQTVSIVYQAFAVSLKLNTHSSMICTCQVI